MRPAAPSKTSTARLENLVLDDLTTGIRLNQYELLENIGQGGQTTVWSALDHQHQRLVAIKISLAEDLTDLPADLEFFKERTAPLAALNHANVLPILEYDGVGKLRYLIIPYLPASSLRTLLDGVELPLIKVLEICQQIASALQYIHEHRLVHRDIKSTNILMDFNLNSYLADFGLARAVSESTQVLHTGHGTPPYASPEQITATKLTVKSDIYSFGILIYETLTRHLPWKGEKMLGILQVQSANAVLPDPAELNPRVPPGVAAALRQLTARDPQDRPASALAAFELVFQACAATQPDLSLATTSSRTYITNDAHEVMRRAVAQWQTEPSRLPLRLSNFMLSDLTHTQQNIRLDDTQRMIMLYSALFFGRQIKPWWERVPTLKAKLEVCTKLLERDNPDLLPRLIDQLSMLGEGQTLKPAALAPFIERALNTQETALWQKTLHRAQQLVSPAKEWQEISLSDELDERLAELALGRSPAALPAARLVGRLKSESAIEHILASAAEAAVMLPALTAIYDAAGSLPAAVPGPMQAQVMLEHARQKVLARPLDLLSAYLAIALGCAVSFALHTYATYRLPQLMDATRIAVSLERGLVLGATVGLSLFLVRLFVERLNLAYRAQLFIGSLIGAGALIFSLYFYYIFFLDLLPIGWMMALGALLLATSHSALFEFIRPKWAQALGASAIWAALLSLTWLWHLLSNMTPLIFYEYTWAPVQTALVIGGMSLVIGVSSVLMRLRLK